MANKALRFSTGEKGLRKIQGHRPLSRHTSTLLSSHTQKRVSLTLHISILRANTLLVKQINASKSNFLLGQRTGRKSVLRAKFKRLSTSEFLEIIQVRTEDSDAERVTITMSKRTPSSFPTWHSESKIRRAKS